MAGRAPQRCGLHRLRALYQWDGELLGAIEDRGIETIRVHDGDARDVLAWLAGRLDRTGVPPVPRPVAEEAAVEAAAALGGNRSEHLRACCGPVVSSVRERQWRLCRACAFTRKAERRLRLDRPARRPIGGSGPPTGRRRAMSVRRSAKDGRPRISVSSGFDPGGQNENTCDALGSADAGVCAGSGHRHQRGLLRGLRGGNAIQPRIQGLRRPCGRQS